MNFSRESMIIINSYGVFQDTVSELENRNVQSILVLVTSKHGCKILSLLRESGT